MKNFFNVGFRLMRENWFFTLLNWLGITIGITGILLLFLFVDSETSFDKFHHGHSKIFRLTTVLIYNGTENRFALNSGYLDGALVTGVPGVSYSTAFSWGSSTFYSSGKEVATDAGLYADADFLKVFGFTILSGSDDFNDLNDIILTRKMALQIFGDVDVAGKMVDVRNGTITKPLMVSAVIEDLPRNSTLRFGHVRRGSGDWWDSQFSTTDSPGNTLHIFFRTAKEENLTALQTKVDLAFARYKQSADAYFTPVQRLTDIHLNSNYQFELSPGGNGDYMKIFTFILIGFALVTLVNSNNINSSQFFNRIKEIGVRKLLGCDKYKLARLFVLDSVFKILACSLFAVLLSYLILFNVNLSVFSIGPANLTDRRLLLQILTGATLMGIMVGIYPAAKVSVIAIVNALKGKLLNSREWLFSIRNSVIVIQIFAAAIMFSLTLVVLRQTTYLNNKPLGFDRNNLITFFKPENFSRHSWKSFEDKLKDETIFSSAGTSSNLMFRSLSPAYFRGEGQNFQAHWLKVNAGFIETMQIKIVAGRDFTDESSGAHEVVINEQARQEFGLSENPVGTTVDTWFGEYLIVGIISDFHYRGFNSKITPLVLVLDEEYNWTMYARYAPGKHKEALETAQKVWSSFKTDESLGYEFFDDTFNKMLEREHQTQIIVIIFTIISLIVTAIGLTGLIGYMATQSRQEIAIRKVLGSSVWQILMIFGKRFAILVSMGLIFSIPLILWISDTWLSNFEFKITPNAGDILFPALAIVLLTLGIISRQAIGAATLNPIRVLRNE